MIRKRMFMKKLICIFMLSVVGGACFAAAAPKPNIVHILVDDLGWQDVNCYYEKLHGEDSFYETPNIDRVASKGIQFMQAYSPSPTCSPSRAAYLSGKFGVKNGVYHVKGSRMPRAWGSRPELNPFYSARLDPKGIIIPRVLKKAGYTTAHVGKWHVCGENMVPNPLQLGFDFSFGEGHVYNDTEIVDPKDKKINNKEGIFAQPKDRLKDFDNPLFLPLLEDERPYDSLTDISLRWLNKVGRKDQPFFLNFCPKLVHGPIMTRDRKRLAHYCKKLGIDFPTDPGSIADPDAAGLNNPYYASMVDSVDWMVGEVVKTLEAIDDPRNPGHKLIDNTYLIISSDNGGAQRLATWKGLDGKKTFEKVTDNAPLREGKSWMYEGGVRIPMIVMGPGIAGGRVNIDTPVHLLDLFPTFMAMGGMAPDDSLELDGANILPVLKGETTTAHSTEGSDRDSLFWHHPADNKSFSVIRRGPWKLMKNTGPGLTEAPDLQLFKLDQDLGEQNNLVDEHPEVTQQLLTSLSDWMAQHDARVPYLNPDSSTPLPGKKDVPVVTGMGSEKMRLWATFKATDTAPVKKAFLLYSLNGGTELKFRAPRLEEWVKAPAQLQEGRVEAVAPPGMTHGIFCLVDENNFLIYSEPVPPVGGECRIDGPVSTFLADGFAYRPGLLSLIKVGHQARKALKAKGVPTDALQNSLKAARATCKEPVDDKLYAVAIRNLRHAIRAFDGQVSEASLADLNSLPLGKW
ncbi:MAG: arylsulfatase A-like enzyme [Kiritimatiellia bacterium]